MRQAKRHVYSVGNFSFAGPTKGAAKQAFDAAVAGYCEHEAFHAECRFGLTFIIWRDLNGWNVSNVSLGHGEATTRASCCNGTTESLDEIVQGCRLHCAHLHWAHDMNDLDHARAAGLNEARTADFLRWARFQRAYAAHRSSGRTDGEAHALACAAA